MKRATHATLDRLRADTGLEYGKLIQKLLAAAFLETGVDRLVERGTQGIDLEVEIAGERCVLEVKTSERDSVRLSAKDIEGLDRQAAGGARVYVAVLTAGPLADWIFARYAPGEFPAARDLTAFRLRAYRDRALEQRIAAAFDRVVDRDAHTALTRRQAGLDEMLKRYGAWGRA